MGEWFESQAAAGSLALAVPVAVDRRPGLLLLAVRDPAAAGLPLLRDRALGRRPRRHQGQPRQRAAGPDARRARCSSSLGLRGGLRPDRRRVRQRRGAGCVAGRTRSRSCSGSALILLGLVFAGVVPWLQRDWRIHKIPAVGLGAAPLIGALFAIGWTPCIGPTYGVIVNLTFTDATATRGALLSLFYAARARDPVHRRRPGLPPYPRRRRLGAAAPGLGDADRRRVPRPARRSRWSPGWWDHLVQWVQLRMVDYGETAL